MTTDPLGSTRVVTNLTGGVVARHDYLPYGAEIQACHSRSNISSELMRWEEDDWEIFAREGPDVPEDEIRVVPLGTLIAADETLVPVVHFAMKIIFSSLRSIIKAIGERIGPRLIGRPGRLVIFQRVFPFFAFDLGLPGICGPMRHPVCLSNPMWNP